MTKPTLVCDTEVYRNYFLAAFRNIETGNSVTLEMYEGQELDTERLRAILYTNRIITFNGINYDIPILSAAMQGKSCAQIKKLSDAIIVTGLKYWIAAKANGVKIAEKIDHIDLIEVAPGIASLKKYAGRLHAPKLQDLPINPDNDLTAQEMIDTKDYCLNDLGLTVTIFDHLKPQIELREKMSEMYGEELRSKSDAQIAETVIKGQVFMAKGVMPMRPIIEVGTTYHYTAPKFITFKDDELRALVKDIESATFTVQTGGKFPLPKELEKRLVKYDGAAYKMGIGGLHSTESSVFYEADDEHVLIDRDVASYYPAIILGCRLYPEHLGHEFLTIYRAIVNQRLKAKASGDKVTAESLKITINGSFGKFGSMWSALYSPNLMIQVTLTGQLALLMLIEQVTNAGGKVVSANTDGVVIYARKDALPAIHSAIGAWEMVTGFDTEETAYRGYYARDVNNYVAIKQDGTFKAKGIFTPPGIAKDPANEICARAVVEFLKHGTPLETTICGSKDIRDFVTLKAARGGAWLNDETYLGKTVRWYYRKGSKDNIVNRLGKRAQVAGADGVAPAMALPEEFPQDVDYMRYLTKAREYLQDMGYNKEIETCL